MVNEIDLAFIAKQLERVLGLAFRCAPAQADAQQKKRPSPRDTREEGQALGGGWRKFFCLTPVGGLGSLPVL